MEWNSARLPVLALGMLLMLPLSGCVSSQSRFSTQPDRAAELNLELGIEHLRRGNLAQAKERLDRSLQQNARNPMAQVASGLLYDRLGDRARADNHFARALSLAPDDPDVQNNYAAYLCRTGRFDRGEKLALQAAGNALYRSPEVAYVNAGSCARGAGRFDEAQSSLRRAVTIKPDFGEALFQLAELSHEQADHLSARGFLERYQQAAGVGPDMLWLGVRIERALGNDEAVQRYGQRLKSEYPSASQTQALLDSEQNAG